MEKGKQQRQDEKHLRCFTDIIAVNHDVFAEHEHSAGEHDQLLGCHDDDGGPGKDLRDDSRVADERCHNHHLVQFSERDK